MLEKIGFKEISRIGSEAYIFRCGRPTNTIPIYGYRTQEEVDYKGPQHHFNSTAQLIKHVMYVDLNWVYRIKGLPLPQSLKEQYGPMIDENNRLPMVKGMSLNTLMSTYKGVLSMLKELCTQLTDADLDRVVIFGHENEKQYYE